MILVTTGMSEHSFNRLFEIIDELCENGPLKNEHVIVQTGNSNYTSKNFETINVISNDEFNKLVDECDFIISHAGTGSVVSSLKKNKKVIVFPRLYKYQEHTDDHQLELAELFDKEKYVLVAKNKEELEEAILKIKDFKPKKFISNNDKINDLIIDFIEK